MRAFYLIVRNQMACYGIPFDRGCYDLSKACPICGAGAVRLEPLRLPTAKFKARIAYTYDFEIIITPRLVSELRKIAPECLREVFTVTAKDVKPSGYYQLIAQYTLPPWSKKTTGFEKEDECSHCKRDGFYNIPHAPLKLVYDEKASPFKVAETYECFGKAILKEPFKGSRIAPPLLIVNEAIRDLLTGEKGVEFEPVTFPKNENGSVP